MTSVLPDRDRPRVGCPRPAYNVWVLDLVLERFHNLSPGGFESLFINAWDSETKEEVRVEETVGRV